MDILVNDYGQVNYSASKAAIEGMTKFLSKELGSRNITVNSLAPPFIIGYMTEDLGEEGIDRIE